MGNIDPTLGFNFPTETILKIVRIIHFCLQQNHFPLQQDHFLELTMNDVIDEINGALQLEEGLKVEEGAMKIEIPQYASQSKTRASLETTLDHEFEWQRTCDDILDFEYVDINRKGKRQQQPQTIFTQIHGSRSVFQIVLIYHLMQEMIRGLIVNNLCCGIVQWRFVHMGPFHCRDGCGDRVLTDD